MTQQIKRAAVLGAGTMGTGIAAHLAGLGIETVLLDIPPRDLEGKDKDNPKARNRLVTDSLAAAKKAKPPVFHYPEDQQLIEVGNFDDNLDKLSDCDWIVEVVVENLKIKQGLYEKVEKVRKPGSLITSNTSGLKLEDLIKGRSEDFQKHFFITHFFNPPRFMKLLELVSGDKTDPKAVEQFATFGAEVLGKGIVYGKDTPNFIANRIGVYSLMYTLHGMKDAGLTVEEIDAVFGPVSGRPKSAVFRTADLVGLDVMMHVSQNCYDACPDDECRDVFQTPDFLKKMVDQKMLGAKTKAGFYKKVGKDIHWLDVNSFEYKPKGKVRADSIGAARKIEDVGQRVKKLVSGDDKFAKFAWDVTARSLIYAANRMGEICDDVVNCDRAMRWGFNWELGPFEQWDALGVVETIERMKADSLKVPQWVEEMVASGQTSFYGGTAAKQTYFDVTKKTMVDVPVDDRQITVLGLREQNNVVEKNAGATLLDMGDGVLLLEFNTKYNIVDDDVGKMLFRATELAEEQGWNGVVIGNDHPQAFCAGANLFAIMVAIKQEKWDDVSNMIVGFQNANMRLRHSSIPTVAAPSGLALGGGCEITMSADAVVSHLDLYTGLVEVGVGLIPAACGCLRMLERYCGNLPDDPSLDPMPFINEAFKQIAMAAVSAGAHDAKRLNILRRSDSITANRDLLLHDAKQTVLGMKRAGYRPARKLRFRLPGKNGAANLRWFVDNMRQGKQVSDHDFLIASKLADVLCGGDTTTRQWVSEQDILDLEREAFMSLCGEKKSQERIQHMLTAKKPLRN